MPVPRFEVPSGDVDGVNKVFTVSVPYKPGTTAVFLNGLLQERSLEDGWYESDPAAGEVTLKEAPRGTPTGYPDVIQIFFIDTSPALPETIVSDRLQGRLRALDELEGRLVQQAFLQGALSAPEALLGRLVGEAHIRGVLRDVEPLVGRLREVCVC